MIAKPLFVEASILEAIPPNWGGTKVLKVGEAVSFRACESKYFVFISFCYVCVCMCVGVSYSLFCLVHRGMGPEVGEDRYVLFWLSYDSEVLGSGMIPQVDADQVTPFSIAAKVGMDAVRAALFTLSPPARR